MDVSFAHDGGMRRRIQLFFDELRLQNSDDAVFLSKNYRSFVGSFLDFVKGERAEMK